MLQLRNLTIKSTVASQRETTDTDIISNNGRSLKVHVSRINLLKLVTTFSVAMLLCSSMIPVHSQVVVIPAPIPASPKWRYEYGYLPGKKFPFYSTIEKYDLNGLVIRVELRDDRFIFNSNKTDCSDINISNNSEFTREKSIVVIKTYIETLFKQSNIMIDSLADNTLKIFIEALDVRLLGFGQIAVHGLCQMKIKYQDFEQTYCIDIEDGDKHAPLSKRSFVTRKTASRYMLSAAIREVIEKILIDIDAGK